MSDIKSISQSDLVKRRLVLRRHRRIKQIQFIWRKFAVSCLLSGLILKVTQPIGVVKEAKQTNNLGNQRLSEQVIHSFLGLSSPKSLLKIQSEDFARSLESQPTIADASVTVRGQERVPVAINITKNRVAPNTGLIAEDSLWMPIHSDAAPNSTSFQMPNLKVLGQVEQCQSYWHELYKASSYLQVKVSKIDCQDPYNLILKTELGDVHLGPYSLLLAEQMRVLQKMHRLLTQVPISQIVYIDLSNPTHPLIQTKVVP